MIEGKHMKTSVSLTVLLASFALFDLLVDGNDVLLGVPWSERRKRLERVLRRRTNQRVHISPSIPGDGEEMLERMWPVLTPSELRIDAAFATLAGQVLDDLVAESPAAQATVRAWRSRYATPLP